MRMLIESTKDKSRCSWAEADKDRALAQSSALAESVRDRTDSWDARELQELICDSCRDVQTPTCIVGWGSCDCD